ncbi:MAG: hypothetical protein AABX12_03995 [Nanoarchaeota archaeon]
MKRKNNAGLSAPNGIRPTDYIPILGVYQYCTRMGHVLVTGVNALMNEGGLEAHPQRYHIKSTLEEAAFLLLYNLFAIDTGFRIIEATVQPVKDLLEKIVQ